MPALGLLLGLLSAACDESAEQRKPGPAAAAPTTAAAPATSAPADAPKAPEAKADPAPTAVAGSPGAPASVDLSSIVRNYSGCYSACFTERASETNRETCKLTCDAVAESALAGLTGAPPKDAFMKVLTTFNGCVNACYDDKSLSATNRATCVLTCQDAAEVAASAPPKAAP